MVATTTVDSSDDSIALFRLFTTSDLHDYVAQNGFHLRYVPAYIDAEMQPALACAQSTCKQANLRSLQEDNYTYHKITSEFRATRKRPAQEQFGGGAKRRKTNIELENQALDNTLVNFTINLSDEDQTVAKI